MAIADNERYKVESLEQKEAFELYYSLGEKRDVGAVAERVGKSKRTVYEWSRRFNWQERVQQRDITVGQELEKKTINAVVDEKANYRKIIKATISEFVRDLKDGKIKIKSIQDFERLVKLDLILMGEASEISKVDSNMSMTEADREALKEFGAGVSKMFDSIPDHE